MDGYVRQFNNAVKKRDGLSLAHCLSLRDKHYAKIANQSQSQWQARGFLRGLTVSEEWREIFELHLSALRETQLCGMYQRQEALVREFGKIYKKGSGWLNVVMGGIITDYRLLATELDMASTPPSQEHRTTAARLIQSYLTSAVMDKCDGDDSRKWGTLYVANNLLKMYMQVTSKLGDNVIKSIDHNLTPDVILTRFPKAQIVTFNYMMGLHLFSKGDYNMAAEKFGYAFQHCKGTSVQNKQLCLQYLVPCRLAQGVSPTDSLLRKYKLDFYIPLVAAVREGNVGALDRILDDGEAVFVRRGLYLGLDMLRLVAYRNLFRRMVITRSSLVANNGSGPLAVELQWFASALNWQLTNPVEESEVECIVAGLIYRGYVRGYIHHGLRKVVLSKQRAFPPIREVKLSA